MGTEQSEEIRQHAEDTKEPFKDGLHILYVNSEIQGDTDLGRLMQDFHCTKPEDMHFKELRDRAHYFKETEEGVTAMCKAMEDMRNDAIKADRVKNALKMLNDPRLSHDDVALYSGLSLDEVKELAGEKTA